MSYVFAIVFFIGMTLGQAGGVSLGSGITVYLQDVFLILLLIYSAFHIPKRFTRHALSYPMILFICACGVSLVVNASRFALMDMVISAFYALRWVGYASLYTIVFILPQRPIWWLWGLYGVGSAVAALGLAQYIWYPYLRNLSYLGWDPHLYRVFSTLFDPNFAATLFVCTLWLGIYLWTKAKNRWTIAISEAVVLIALLLTYSRSGYLAFIAGVLTIAVLSKRAMVAVVIIALFLATLFFLPRKDGEGVKLLRTASTVARIGNWQRGATLISEAPLLGHGFNTLRYVQRMHSWVDDSEMVSHAGAGLDNSIEFLWATTGLLGLGIYLWLYSRMVGLARVATRKPKTFVLGTITIATLVSVLVSSQFSNSLFFPQMMIWLWILMASVERMISSDR